MKTKIKASQSLGAILGKYSGECADANITNLNGLDITREVWETVFSSEEYKKAIELGHLIGFLGHPEDPGCQDFEHACIVMTEGHIDDSGKVYGEFNLIDTPVGRIVKAFQDAGVTFGISVRGAGDIVDNSVDPETFVFRGFDLVTFPAYPNSIPTFTEIAASTKLEDQMKYKKICASVDKEIDSITSKQTIDQIQANFAKNSDTYKKLEVRKKCIDCEDSANETVDVDEDLDQIYSERVQAMTDMYLDTFSKLEASEAENIKLREDINNARTEATRKLKAVQRITASQIADIQVKADSKDTRINTLVSANSKLKEEMEKVNKANLAYLQKTKIAASTISEKNSIIASLRHELDETVNEVNASKTRTSNLDVKMKELNAQIAASKKMLTQYQSAYAKLYASAVGSDLSNLKITASTSVEELQRAISGSSLKTSITSIQASHTPQYEEVDVVDDVYSDDIVTL